MFNHYAESWPASDLRKAEKSIGPLISRLRALQADWEQARDDHQIEDSMCIAAGLKDLLSEAESEQQMIDEAFDAREAVA